MPGLSNNKTIAQNTVFLYLRMLIIMAVTLYTSRVILQKLGIDDFGLYQTVGGIVGFLAFISNALATGTSRFITFALGKSDEFELRRTFSTTFMIHIVIGLFIVLLAETVGLWYVHNKMVISLDRFEAVLWVFHISIVTVFLSIIVVPFNAEVIAHEKMSVFAYIGIVEAAGKLGVAYLLSSGVFDKLILYAILLFMIQAGIFFYYIWYCKHSFSETVFMFTIDTKLFRDIFSFSGWSLLANGAIALSNQGILLLLNLFFTPAVVTARSISIQVNNVANQFVQNFRTAVNPQIVKLYAASDFEASKNLLLESTKYSYYLMLLIALPLMILAKPLLNLWLVEVPEYTDIFLQIAIAQSLFQVFDTSLYTALYAKGRIKENAMISPLVIFLCFPIVYFLFKSGASPIALSWSYFVGYAILGLFIKPILVNKIVCYNMREIMQVFFSCMIVTLVAIIVPFLLFLYIGVESFLYCIIILFSSIISVVVTVWYLGMTLEMRLKIIQTIHNKFDRSIL